MIFLLDNNVSKTIVGSLKKKGLKKWQPQIIVSVLETVVNAKKL